MKRYLDPTKLLQEGKITSSEFERIKRLSSKWDSPIISCIFMALAVIIGTSIILGPLVWFPHIIILAGLLLMGLGTREDKC